MKKIFIIMSVLIVLLGMSCKQDGSSSNENEIPLPIFGGTMNGRSIISLGRNWDNEAILTDGFSPVITGLKKEEIDVDLTEEGSSYRYQETTFDNSKVNIVVEYTWFERFKRGYEGEPAFDDMVYVYTGCYNDEDRYYGCDDLVPGGDSMFQLVTWTNEEGKIFFSYKQEIIAEYVENNELIDQFLIYLSMRNVPVEGDGTNFVYSTNENIFTCYYIYNKLENISHEDYCFSGNGNIIKDATSFTITTNNIISVSKEGPRTDNSISFDVNDYYQSLTVYNFEELSKLYHIAIGEYSGTVPSGEDSHGHFDFGYLATSPFYDNPIVDSITYTKTF